MIIMIYFRSATPEDSEFLYQLKKKTMKEYIAQTWGWNEQIQRDYHQKNFNPEKCLIIQKKGQDIGCISIEEQPDTLFLNIIEISPEFQNLGIGKSVIQDLIDKGLQENKGIALQVLKVNHKAIKLYKTMGFAISDETETHYYMIHSSN